MQHRRGHGRHERSGLGGPGNFKKRRPMDGLWLAALVMFAVIWIFVFAWWQAK